MKTGKVEEQIFLWESPVWNISTTYDYVKYNIIFFSNEHLKFVQCEGKFTKLHTFHSMN